MSVELPPAVVVMGVSAAGKSTVASGLADRLGVPWVDADDLHPPANVEKMAAGIPLVDDDRWPWLDAVGQHLADGQASGGVVIACSALKRSYRDRLRATCPGVRFVHLDGTRDLLAQRAASRSDHFMPAALLESQIATLEPLASDEAGTVFDVSAAPEELVAAATRWVKSDA